VIADLVGKGKHIRTVPIPVWAKRAIDEWTTTAAINGGAIFRRVSRLDKIWGDSITPKAICHVVKAAAKRADIKNLAPHDLRRTCARSCHLAGGELEQIQFLLGHASVQTTERYLGCKQKLSQAVNDNLGLEDTCKVVTAPKPTSGRIISGCPVIARNHLSDVGFHLRYAVAEHAGHQGRRGPSVRHGAERTGSQ